MCLREDKAGFITTSFSTVESNFLMWNTLMRALNLNGGNQPCKRFTADEMPQCQQTGRISFPNRSSWIQGGLRASTETYSSIRDYKLDQCIAGKGAHKESPHNVPTHDKCICTGILHLVPSIVLLWRDCQSTCTDLKANMKMKCNVKTTVVVHLREGHWVKSFVPRCSHLSRGSRRFDFSSGDEAYLLRL